MVDVQWDDRAPAGDFIANEFRGDVFGNACPERFTAVLKTNVGAIALRCLERLFPAKILANGDKLHLRRDHAAAGICQLSCRSAVDGFPGPPFEAGERLQPDTALCLGGVLKAEIA